jgi:hypothetical protein
MNLQAYADHRKAQGLRGTSHVAVLKAIESGRLTEPAVRKVGNRWHIDAAMADDQWAGNTDPTQARATPPTPPPPPQEPEPPPLRGRQPHLASSGPSLAEAKRARAVYQAERERLAVMKEKGELVMASEVRQEAARLARQVRDLLLIIPSRNAAKVATMQDQEEVRALLQAEIESALRGLGNA